MITRNKRLIGILVTASLILLIPIIAMQFTNEVNWGSSDFAMAAALLFGTGLICELILRKVKKTQHRVIICAVLFIGLLAIWAELAVGIFGTAFAGN